MKILTGTFTSDEFDETQFVSSHYTGSETFSIDYVDLPMNLITKFLEVFNNSGYKCSQIIDVQYHRTQISKEDRIRVPEEHEFGWHCDNVNYGYPVYSMLIYLQKDSTLKQFDFLIDADEIPIGVEDQTKMIKPTNIIKIPVAPIDGRLKCVIFDGNVLHTAEPYFGYGKRTCLLITGKKI